ncbi:MAG: flagellar hook-basal body complex protein FliE [Thermoanaerobacterales bacterium]|nr:flagellar hook-basal body complex protein FliE [Bacillota bacterium]MDI6906142.1 flagellar hook-basal body complex protein FliE [Thermoanaerobacterales bacterium]
MINDVTPAVPPGAGQAAQKAAQAAGGGGVSFGEFLSQALDKVNAAQVKADETIKGFLAGEVDDLHQVVVAMKEAEIWMQLTVQTRNKLVEAYQEIFRMPV